MHRNKNHSEDHIADLGTFLKGVIFLFFPLEDMKLKITPQSSGNLSNFLTVWPSFYSWSQAQDGSANDVHCCNGEKAMPIQ